MNLLVKRRSDIFKKCLHFFSTMQIAVCNYPDIGSKFIAGRDKIEVPRMLAVLDGAKRSGLPVWVGLSCAPDENGVMCLQSGTADANGVVFGHSKRPLVDALEALAGKDVPLLSFMHTDVRDIDACLEIAEKHWQGLIGIYAHSGKYKDGKWTFEGTITPEDYAQASRRWLKHNVGVIGGCCGIRPDHIAALGKLDSFQGQE